MRLLSYIFKSFYLFFPPLVILSMVRQYDKWLLLIAIFTSYSGSLSRSLKFHGLPIFYILFCLFLQYYGHNIFGFTSFLGLWLFWGYGMTFLAEKSFKLSCKSADADVVFFD